MVNPILSIRQMRKYAYVMILTAVGLVLSLMVISSGAKAAGDQLLSQNRPAFASSVKGNNSPSMAVDGDLITRWESVFGQDSQWMYVDLGASASISRVVVKWEGAYAKSFRIEVSDDEYTWTPIYTNTQFTGGTTDVNITASGRYVRVFSVERALKSYGVSLYELQVYGSGGVNSPPKEPVANVALYKQTASSSEQNSGTLQPKDYATTNVTDGNRSTRWSSQQSDPQWVYVDLGQITQIGKVVLRWETAFGRAYDIQVSDNGQSWSTVYRQPHGSGGTDEISLYTSGRYVRMYGMGRGSKYGYSLFEFEVYPYQNGDPKPNYSIPNIPAASKVSVGSGSYEINDITQLEALYPNNKSNRLQSPIPSNDWWQNLLVADLGGGTGIITLPLKNNYTTNGLGFMNPGTGYVSGNGKAVNADGKPDLFLMANNITSISNMQTIVDDYGDYSVDVVLSDDNTAKMKTTFVQGSPYVYNTFSDPNSVEIYAPGMTKLFDDNNVNVLTSDGSSITADHIGIEVTNTDNADTPHTFVRSYGIFAPPGTQFTKAGNKIKIKLGSGEAYLSVATLPSNSDLNYYHQHGYAFVTDTHVNYSYDIATASVATSFTSHVVAKRSDLSADTLMAMQPHQWKISNSSTTTRTYPSIRGLLKVHEGNSFATRDNFYGIIPQFVEPNDPDYSRSDLVSYLDKLDIAIAKSSNIMNQDPYWQGKVLHPTSLAALISDQLGDYDRRDRYLNTLRKILTNWYTYSSDDALHTYYFHYSPEWGSIFPWADGWGINTGLTDHHYTYGYFVYASAVLASFDEDFKANYGDMVEHLIRDYANPSRTDSMYPWFRNFDPYNGHSWAGAYADSSNGNNQEAAGEALNGWAGEYLWGILTGNNEYRDAGAWGFTTELKAIEQYWFNNDHDNWLPEYQHGVAGQVWGSSYLYGTYFADAPVNIYGIHWLPTAEWMSYYGKDTQKAADLYAAFLRENGHPEEGWQHIVWPFEALSNPQDVISKWDPSVMQQNEVFNAYWFIHNMASYGSRATDVWADNWSSVGIYKKGSQYTAQIWNPTSAPIIVEFRNAAGGTGSAKVAAHSLVKVNPMENNRGDTLAPSAPDNLTAVATSNNQIHLSWGASADNVGVAGYDIYRNGTFISSSISTSYNDTGLTASTTYSYTVKAKDTSGNVSTVSNVASAATQSGSSGGNVTDIVPDRTGWTATPTTETLKENQQLVTAAELKNDGKAAIFLGDGKTEAVVPVDVAQNISKSVEVRSQGVSVNIPATLFQELAGKVQGKTGDSKIIVRIAQEMNGNAGIDGGSFNFDGLLYNLDLVLVDRDGNETKLSRFSEPATVVLSYDSDMNKDLIGIYYFDENSKKWVYIGGKVDADKHTITGSISHFSKYAVLEYDQSFVDVQSSHWAYNTLKALAAKHIVTGISATEFGPNQGTTRAEFVALLVRALGLKATSPNASFSDVNASDWYAQDVAAAYEAGLISGLSDTEFAPQAQITREQMAILIVRAYEYVKGTISRTEDHLSDLKDQKDQKQVSSWATDGVNKAIELGLMKGQSASAFVPLSNAIRAETAQAIFNLLNLIEAK